MSLSLTKQSAMKTIIGSPTLSRTTIARAPLLNAY